MCWNTWQRNAINVKGAEEVRFILELGDTKNLFTQSIRQQNPFNIFSIRQQNSKEGGTKIYTHYRITLDSKLSWHKNLYSVIIIFSNPHIVWYLSYHMIWYHPIHLYITYHMISNDDMISSYIFICSILISSQWVTDQRSVRGFNLHKCKKRPIHLTVKCIAVKIRIITLINYFTLSKETNKCGFYLWGVHVSAILPSSAGKDWF